MPSNHERRLPSRPDTRHRLRLVRLLIALLAAIAAIAAMECIVFNLPFWRTLGASTDTNAVHNTLGSGLTRRNDGMLTVTDPTKAYLELTADGTSDYLRIDTASSKVIDKAREQAEAESEANDDKEVFKPLATIHVRADVDGITGQAQSMNPDAIRSHYVKAPGAGIVRIWIQEERGAIVPVTDSRANVHVPFVINWMRVLAMALVLLMIAVWRPGSRLWRITLDPSSTRQRLAFVGLLAIPTLLIGVSIIHELWYTSSLVFHVSGDYTYDFDQYGHVADALVAGRPWLDLPVPEQLAATEHPYDVATRAQLLANGASPLYWDYAYYDGHWYSYFGVLPAVLLFVPYRLLAGHNLPTSAAEYILVLLFIIFFSLLVLRVIHRVMPKTSVAAASLVVVSSDRWQAGDAKPLSLPRLALGALCIAANFGCRPTFTLAALLAFPLFWPQIRALGTGLRTRRIKPLQALRAPLAVIIPAILVVTPLMAWNMVRFDSPFNFGNAYQFSISDMTRYTTPSADMPANIWYYLFLPLRFMDRFPWLAGSPAPMPQWGYYEVMVGAIFTATPLTLMALALPLLRRLETHGMRPWLMSCLAVAAVLVVFDSRVGGLGWRYSADFGWLISLASIPGLLWLVNGREPSRSLAGANDAASGDGIARVTPWRWLMRWVVMLAVLWALGIAILSCFVQSRSDSMIANNPTLWHQVQSWFTLL